MRCTGTEVRLTPPIPTRGGLIGGPDGETYMGLDVGASLSHPLTAVPGPFAADFIVVLPE